MTDNLLIATVLAVFFLMFVLFGGELDLMDALVYWLTDGGISPEGLGE